MSDIRPPDDGSWRGLPGTTWRRAVSTLLVALALALGIAAAGVGGFDSPGHPDPGTVAVHPPSLP
ncbi:MAG: hypothetical protein ACRDYD_04760 [Acidimicrobiales bacterium]